MAAKRDAAPPTTVLNPAARLLWRSQDSVQLELGGRRVVVDGVGRAGVRQLIGRPDGADERPVDTATIDSLTADGYVWPAPVRDDDPRCVPARPRLAGELVALAARHGDSAAELLSARSHATVAIEGPGRISGLLAAVLGSAGVGSLRIAERGAAGLGHALPGGTDPGDEGAPLLAAIGRAVARVAPDVHTAAPTYGDRPDLTVLAVDEPLDGERRAALHATETVHLVVSLHAGRAVVGPLVIPGLTSCLRCADLHRVDRDPAWDALAVQLSQPHRSAGAAEVATAVTAAGVAAAEILRFLDGDEPATVEGTLEILAPDWRVRRRSWPAHPDCDCMR